jgi:hypothetical protein
MIDSIIKCCLSICILAHVNEANHNLNGDQKLATAQQNAKTTLGTLDHI